MAPDELVIDVIQYAKYTQMSVGILAGCDLAFIVDEISDFVRICKSVVPAPDMGDYLLACQWLEWELNGFDAANGTSQADSDAVAALLAQRGISASLLHTMWAEAAGN
jgi:hypothetical protein